VAFVDVYDGVKYFVTVDPRYDFEFVKAEVVAAIKCA